MILVFKQIGKKNLLGDVGGGDMFNLKFGFFKIEV